MSMRINSQLKESMDTEVLVCTDTNHQRFMAPHSKTSESQLTGVSVTGVKTGARIGDETRVKNMNIIWIIRVW